MEALGEWLIAFISDQDNLVGLAVLAGAALIEYVFPPFPGDTITLFGAVLITSHGWSAPLVLAAVIAGALAGTAIDWSVGRWLRRGGKVPVKWQGRMERVAIRFQRHGAAYLFVARFLPGLRAISCVAAGMAGMALPVVLLWSGLASLIYNLMLIAVGSAVGANLAEFQAIISEYTAAAWIVLGAAALIAVAVWAWHRRRRGTP
jgi:membrane protein DedA with SNARE-associated domain